MRQWCETQFDAQATVATRLRMCSAEAQRPPAARRRCIGQPSPHVTFEAWKRPAFVRPVCAHSVVRCQRSTGCQPVACAPWSGRCFRAWAYWYTNIINITYRITALKSSWRVSAQAPTELRQPILSSPAGARVSNRRAALVKRLERPRLRHTVTFANNNISARSIKTFLAIPHAQWSLPTMRLVLSTLDPMSHPSVRLRYDPAYDSEVKDIKSDPQLIKSRIIVGTSRLEDAPQDVRQGFDRPQPDYFRVRCSECGEAASFLSKRFAHLMGGGFVSKTQHNIN